ncbi:hypothetical protein R3P38DRAFT_3342627 [Favolaschia claudopus]|uniref:Uncharacterized protein n=1 Tax=Favolaschia claudopus TaxID=2862362 RepID=A0AAW0DS84_9AGAR
MRFPAGRGGKRTESKREVTSRKERPGGAGEAGGLTRGGDIRGWAGQGRGGWVRRRQECRQNRDMRVMPRDAVGSIYGRHIDSKGGRGDEQVPDICVDVISHRRSGRDHHGGVSGRRLLGFESDTVGFDVEGHRVRLPVVGLRDGWETGTRDDRGKKKNTAGTGSRTDEWEAGTDSDAAGAAESRQRKRQDNRVRLRVGVRGRGG